MAEPDFSRTALLLVGHGSSQDEAALPVYQHAAELRARRLFAEVREGFWKQEPRVSDVLSGFAQERVFIIPLFMSEGYFSERVIPTALGFADAGTKPARLQRKGNQVLAYSKPVGSHQTMINAVLDRAQEVLRASPSPPGAREITLFVAAHGTEQDENSRKAVEFQAEGLRSRGIYAAVHAVFLEEQPRISECYALSRTRNLVVVPFFLSDGPHAREDVPIMLGAAPGEVRTRARLRQPTWPNPTELQGKLVWYASPVGTDARIAEVILRRAAECAAAVSD